MQQQIPNNTGVVKDEISLKELILSVQDWWKYIKGKWKVILIAGVIGGALGLVYSLMTPVKYIAEANFVLDNAKSSASGYASIASKFGLNVGTSSDGLFSDEDNMIVFLKSRTMGAQTLLTPIDVQGRTQLLIDYYLDFSKQRSKWKEKSLKNLQFNAYPHPRSLLADSIITAVYKKMLNDNLIVEKPDKEGNIVQVKMISTNELFSKLYCETLIKNTADFYMRTMTQKSQENVDVLQRQVDSIKTLLNESIAGVAVNTDAVPNINPAYQRLKIPSQRKIVDVEMNKAILEGLVTNLELAKINLRKDSPLFQMIDEPVLPLQKKRTGKLKGLILGGGIISIIFISFLSIKLFLLNTLRKG